MTDRYHASVYTAGLQKDRRNAEVVIAMCKQIVAHDIEGNLKECAQLLQELRYTLVIAGRDELTSAISDAVRKVATLVREKTPRGAIVR